VDEGNLLFLQVVVVEATAQAVVLVDMVEVHDVIKSCRKHLLLLALVS
jgi:hypothetical protein